MRTLSICASIVTSVWLVAWLKSECSLLRQAKISLLPFAVVVVVAASLLDSAAARPVSQTALESHLSAG